METACAKVLAVIGRIVSPSSDIWVTPEAPFQAAMNLTKAIIEAVTYQGTSHPGANGRETWSRCVLWDDAVRGLGLRITPAGKKSFVLSYSVGSRKRLMTLGPYGVLTLPNARAKALRKLADVLDGRDPLWERQTASRAPTVKQLAERYVVEHAKLKNKPSTVKTNQQMLRDYILPKLGHLKVVDVSRKDVIGLHYAMREKPYVANRVVALLSKLFNLAEK